MRRDVMRRGWAPLVACSLVAASCTDATVTVGTDASSSVSATTATTTTRATTATTATTATAAPTTLHRPAARLVLVGDSLALEASPYLSAILGYTSSVSYTFGGTAACDWFTLDMGAAPNTVVVLSFHGNVATPCVQPPSDTTATVGWIVAKYRKDVSQLIDTAMAAGSDVVLVGQPENSPTYSPPDLETKLNTMYARLAIERGVGYVDAGAAVETSTGEFTLRLACLPEDQSCASDGTIAVRNDDGIHFCPVAPVQGPKCPVYSSGAYRYAKAMAALATVI